jgi:hypothetical protein
MLDDTPQKVERHYGNHVRVRPFLGDASDRQLRDVLPPSTTFASSRMSGWSKAGLAKVRRNR